jgi:tRNA threonylcarbamoyladenosine modification (KEOPS) complex  Pcc1 subunit
MPTICIAGQAVQMAKQAFHAREREFQELLGGCREKVARATKIADMRVADEKTAGRLALDAKQRELQDLNSHCEHRLANAAKALAKAVEKEKVEAKAERSKLEMGWERERKASAWDIQQLRGEAEALAKGKRACEAAMEQAQGDLAHRQAALVSPHK